MPRLGSFLVCEKIILDQQSKPTLIAVYQSISAFVPEGQDVPKDTIGGMAWAIFCEWFFAEDELSKRFEEVVEVMLPDGSPSPIRGRLAFTGLAKDRQGTRAYVNLFGMPIAQTGFLAVNVWIESEGIKVTDVFTYHIKVEHTKQAPQSNDGGSFVPTLTQ